MICHYWYFLNTDYKYEPELCKYCNIKHKRSITDVLYGI